MLDAVLDALLDTAKLLPILFLTYLLMEHLEHHSAGKLNGALRSSRRAGPALGAVLGLIPQCGLSGAAASLYAGGAVTMGTLVAVFLATSDEMLPIMISAQVPVGKLLLILGLTYLFLSPKEANHYLGYRCYYGMGSVQAWRFTQKLGGLVLGGLGLVLTVVMLFLSMSLRGMAVEAMVWRAAKCLIWEAALAILANLAVTGAAFVTFDAKGNYRSKRR